MEKRTGGCRCGDIRYEIQGAPVAQVACHCRDCQYVSGGGANFSMVFNRSGFTVLKGAPDSHPELVAIKVGSLDDRSDFRVQVDIWMKSAPSWHRPHEGARQVAGNLA